MGADTCTVEEDPDGTGSTMVTHSTSLQLKGDHVVVPGGQVSQSRAWSWSHFGPLVHIHDEAFGHREMHCPLSESFSTCIVMAGAGAGSRAGWEREMQLDPNIPD